MAQRGCSAEEQVVEMEGQSKNWWKIGSDSVDASMNAPPPNSIFDTTVTPSIRSLPFSFKETPILLHHHHNTHDPTGRAHRKDTNASERHHPHRYRTIE